jgi:hypothetical protein
MADHDDAPTAGPWPDASLRPADDAPPAAWARFYRDHCGWVVLPTAGPADVMSYAIALHTEALSDYAVDHPGEDVPEDVSLACWDHAREMADTTAGRPIGHLYNAWLKSPGGSSKPAKVTTASDITDEMIALAWEPLDNSRGPRAHADERGIAILPNRSERGLPACLVDVDPRHGGDADGPWGMALAGPKASTPGGGVHTLMLATGKETASADLGPGVDVVAGGGTMIPVPAGSATPGRQWLRWDAPVPAPDALRKRGRKKAPPRVGEAAAGGVARERQPGDDDDAGAAGHTAALMLSPVGDGERNHVAGALVGLLARPGACPDDFVQACLETLAEEMAGREVAYATVTAEAARWRHLLTRGPRDADFAAEVLEVWYATRNTASKRWKTTPRKFALSVWKVCDRREEGQAGAEDFGIGPMLTARPASWPPLPEYVPAVAPIDHSAPAEPPPPPPQAAPAPAERVEVPYPAPAPAAVQAASRWRGGIDPRSYTLTLGEDYTAEHLRRDLQREPIQIADVAPAVDFVTGKASTSPDLLTPPVRFGWGHPLAKAKRGISAGEFLAVGASSAGAGKTTFLAWLANGLALQTAMRLLGVPGYERRPLVLPVWVSEMPKKMELYGRLVTSYLGFDRGCLSAGTLAHEDPGVLDMAARHNMTALEVVAEARALENLHGNDPRFPLCVARHQVIRRVKPSKLPRHTRRSGVLVNHRTGPDLIDHLADAVDLFRRDLAELAGAPEDQILPLIILDPVQRFAGGDGESERRAIDAILGAANEVLCEELEAVVVTTNDTTKKAAGGVNVDHFLSAEAPGLMADVFAGSQGIIHHASDVIAVHPERPDPSRPGRTRQWARLLRSRGGGEAAEVFPYEWDKTLGRLTAGEAEPLRAPPVQDERGDSRRGRDGRGQGERVRPGPSVRAFGSGGYVPRDRGTLPD